MEIKKLDGPLDLANPIPPAEPPVPPTRHAEAEVSEAQVNKVSPELEQVERIALALEQFTAFMGKELKFHVHEESRQIQVVIVDPKDDKVITKIPPDELLALAASIDKTVGVFLNRVF